MWYTIHFVFCSLPALDVWRKRENALRSPFVCSAEISFDHLLCFSVSIRSLPYWYHSQRRFWNTWDLFRSPVCWAMIFYCLLTEIFEQPGVFYCHLYDYWALDDHHFPSLLQNFVCVCGLWTFSVKSRTWHPILIGIIRDSSLWRTWVYIYKKGIHIPKIRLQLYPSSMAPKSQEFWRVTQCGIFRVAPSSLKRMHMHV